MRHRSLDEFYRLLLSAPGRDVFNPWTERDDGTDARDNGPRARRRRLAAHLSGRAARVLIGEAAGYQGCHVTGIPFTSERMILAGRVPRVPGSGRRLSQRARPWSEPSATIVWDALWSLGAAADTLLWNAFPWHPHRRGALQSNRTPSRPELESGLAVLEAFLDAFPRAAVLAVGRRAAEALEVLDREAVPLRHPAMGGAAAFRRALAAALQR